MALSCEWTAKQLRTTYKYNDLDLTGTKWEKEGKTKSKLTKPELCQAL